MQGNSRWVSTNQPDIHEKLQEVVERHARSKSQKPIQQHTHDAFEHVVQWLAAFDTPYLILDSCCGVGESTWRLALQHPNAVVIGVDKSFSRLEKHGQQPEFAAYDGHQGVSSKDLPKDTEGVFLARDNYCVVRADVIDFWRLVSDANWNVQQHSIFYPNPYPKASQLQKRWHGCASFQDILRIGGTLQVRSNWEIYIREFTQALRFSGKTPEFSQVPKGEPITPFERKYWNSGQQSWQVQCQL